MLIDTSALMAIHNDEEGFEAFVEAISKAERRWLSAISFVEFALVAKNID